MYKVIIFLGLVFGVNNILAQNLFGVTRVNTKAGTAVDTPRSDSKHYKLQIPISKADIELNLFFSEYVNGKYKQSSNQDRISNFVIPQNHKFVLDFVPQIESTGMFKLYLYYPGVTRYLYMSCNDNTCLKYVVYEDRKDQKEKVINVLLVYEDNKDGKMEKLVNNYIVNGTLKSNSKSDMKLRTQLKRYSILYYATQKMEK